MPPLARQAPQMAPGHCQGQAVAHGRGARVAPRCHGALRQYSHACVATPGRRITGLCAAVRGWRPRCAAPMLPLRGSNRARRLALICGARRRHRLAPPVPTPRRPAPRVGPGRRWRSISHAHSAPG
eukprot:3119577-Lingulodinium_polyedra.AAC.1